MMATVDSAKDAEENTRKDITFGFALYGIDRRTWRINLTFG